MKNVGHIIWKDMRACRWPLQMLLIGFALLLLVGYLQFGRHFPGNPPAVLFTVILASLAFVMVAVIIQEDNLVTTAALWRTRPIGRAELFVAKMAVLLVVFVPAFTPVMMMTSGGGVLQQAIPSVCALMCFATVATVTRDLREFLWSSVLSLVLFLGAFAFASEVSNHFRLPLFDLALLFAGAICAVGLVYRFAGGERRFTVIILLVALILGPLLTIR